MRSYAGGTCRRPGAQRPRLRRRARSAKLGAGAERPSGPAGASKWSRHPVRAGAALHLTLHLRHFAGELLQARSSACSRLSACFAARAAQVQRCGAGA